MNFNIDVIKRKMLVKFPFFGSIVANVSYKENREISTAGTDGKTIYYNPKFLEKLELNEQIFIFAHEICHIAFDHIRRSEGKDPEVWNIATDGVINQFLKRDGLKIVTGGIDIAEAINYDAEQLYDKLLKEKKQKEKSSSSEEISSKGQSCVGDTHSMWKDAIKRGKEGKSSKEQKEGKPKSGGSKQTEEQEAKLQQEINKISKMGEKKAFSKNLEEKRKELETLKEEILKQSMTVGTSSRGTERIINDIGKSKPIIDWRYVLREVVQYDVDWSYKNAYIEDGFIKANLEEQPLPETEIVLDISGSISDLLLRNFLRECKNILQSSRLKVGCFDTRFYGFQEIRTEEDIENMRFEGGGGTDFNVAVRAFTKRVENKIIFTDGYASMPNIPVDAIWIVYGKNAIKPMGGKVIHIDEEQLYKLCHFEQDISYKRKR